LHRLTRCLLLAALTLGLQQLATAAATPIERELVAPPVRIEVDGLTDDLLTAGLGPTGLRGSAPGFANPRQPTPLELRRRAIYQNYRGLIDISAEGGFGRDFGPRDGETVAGVEYLAALRDPQGAGVSAVLLQIPRGFDPRKPCLVVVASSGSRGIYGALPTAAEWALRRGCAVAHTDKGTGVGLWDVDRSAGVRIDGTVSLDRNDPLLSFVPGVQDTSGLPAHSVLLKHAQSRQNPEADWGRYVLRAGKLALVWINREYARQLRRPLTPRNTLVIAAGISNGGGAVLRALELDRQGFFDAGVAAEPNVAVEAVAGEIAVRQGGEVRQFRVRGVYDYASLQGVLQPCAVLAETDDPAVPLAAALARVKGLNEAWCADLVRAADVSGIGAVSQAREARAQLLAAGVHPDALRLGIVNLQSVLWLSVTASYASAYLRAAPGAAPCGLSFAAVDAAGQPRALDALELARAFSDLNGIAPGAGIGIVRAGPDGARSALAAALPDTARCLRALWPAMQPGIAQIQMSADPGRRPVVLLHGRDDGLVSVNHSSRAYVTAHRRRGASADELRYYEIRRAQHFDAFLPLPGMRGRYVPMQPLLNAALEAVYARLTSGTALPPSQAVSGSLRAEPGADAISWRDGMLVIPD
jgi:hydroxybutyrate-dimer hydrolase